MSIELPRLKSYSRMKEIMTMYYMGAKMGEGSGQKMAWITSGAPVEFLYAADITPLYPENHAAMCGIRRKAVEIMGEAESQGYSRDICSYARTDFGSLFSGKTPAGRLPRPDLLVCCNNICQTVLSWYRVLSQHTGAPLIVIDTPFIYDEAPPHAIEYVKRQLEEAVEVAQRVAKRTLKPKELERVGRLSKDAAELWMEVLLKSRNVPAPMSAFDQFILMGPIVELRGFPYTVDFYRQLVLELDGRISKGVGAVRKERHRLIWDNLPIWFRVKKLSTFLAQHGAACVTSTYTNAWGELAPMMTPERPMESLARVYLHPILNRSTAHKLETMRRMVHEYHAHGVLLHSDRSCKPYSIGQMDQRERLVNQFGVPAILLEADHSDDRLFSEEQSESRLTAFLENLGRGHE